MTENKRYEILNSYTDDLHDGFTSFIERYFKIRDTFTGKVFSVHEEDVYEYL